MNEDNYETLKISLEIRGFGEETIKSLKEAMTKGNEEIRLSETFEDNGLTMQAEPVFNKHKEYDHYFFNRIDATLFQGDEILAQSSVRASWMVKAEELMRMLTYGDKVAVYKKDIQNFERNKFNAYISVLPDRARDENGNTILNSYHDNYYSKQPFDLREKLLARADQFPEINEGTVDKLVQQLQHAELVTLTGKSGDTEFEAIFGINAKKGDVHILDGNLEPLKLYIPKRVEEQSTPEAQQSINETRQQDPAGEVKKKPWENRPAVIRRPNQNKGISR